MQPTSTTSMMAIPIPDVPAAPAAAWRDAGGPSPFDSVLQPAPSATCPRCEVQRSIAPPAPEQDPARGSAATAAPSEPPPAASVGPAPQSPPSDNAAAQQHQDNHAGAVSSEGDQQHPGDDVVVQSMAGLAIALAPPAAIPSETGDQTVIQSPATSGENVLGVVIDPREVVATTTADSSATAVQTTAKSPAKNLAFAAGRHVTLPEKDGAGSPNDADPSSASDSSNSALGRRERRAPAPTFERAVAAPTASGKQQPPAVEQDAQSPPSGDAIAEANLRAEAPPATSDVSPSTAAGAHPTTDEPPAGPLASPLAPADPAAGAAHRSRLPAEVFAPGPASAVRHTPTDFDTSRLLSRVARAFSAAQERDGEIRLRLSPPELGSLRLQVQVQDGALVARLETETSAARTALIDNLPALRERLADQGVRIERFDVDLMQRQPGGMPDRPGDQQRNAPLPLRNLQVARPRSELAPPSASVVAGSVPSGRLNVIV